jgi:transcription termination/antitermination protein NusG
MDSESVMPAEKGWYVVRTYSQHERKVKASLEQAVANQSLQDKISKIVIPCEEVVELHKNKKYVKERPFFLGYVFVEMLMDQQTYWLIRNTAGVSGFLGGTKPTMLSEEEKKNLLGFVDRPVSAKPKFAVMYEKGESVRIVDGPFTHFVGVVEEANEERAKLKIMVTVFGRPTPVELDFLQVERI